MERDAGRKVTLELSGEDVVVRAVKSHGGLEV